jgi:VanZ family protein
VDRSDRLFSTDTWGAAGTAPDFWSCCIGCYPGAPPEQLDALHWLARKSAHVVEYAVLAVLWSRALRSRDRPRGWIAPLGLVILTAAIDELHQSTTSTRTGSVADVVLDSAAAAAALIGAARGAMAHERATVDRGGRRHRPHGVRWSAGVPPVGSG